MQVRDINEVIPQSLRKLFSSADHSSQKLMLAARFICFNRAECDAEG